MIGCVLNCGKVANSRGLCHCCYRVALALVKAGITSWEQLELEGKALPPTPRNKRFYSPERYWRGNERAIAECG